MNRILVVDDDGHIRDVMRFALQQGGFQVVEAKDGADALLRFDAGNRSGGARHRDARIRWSGSLSSHPCQESDPIILSAAAMKSLIGCWDWSLAPTTIWSTVQPA